MQLKQKKQAPPSGAEPLRQKQKIYRVLGLAFMLLSVALTMAAALFMPPQLAVFIAVTYCFATLFALFALTFLYKAHNVGKNE